VERLQLTILEQCWRPSFARSLVPKITALERDLDEYLHYFITDRAHTGRITNGRVPADIARCPQDEDREMRTECRYISGLGPTR
jgi:hypothetical protein